MMEPGCISYEEYISAAKTFMEVSKKICDGWHLREVDGTPQSLYLRKETFITLDDKENSLCKAEYVISYSMSYNVPSFAFNLWNSNGVMVPVEDIRKQSFLK